MGLRTWVGEPWRMRVGGPKMGAGGPWGPRTGMRGPGGPRTGMRGPWVPRTGWKGPGGCEDRVGGWGSEKGWGPWGLRMGVWGP